MLARIFVAALLALSGLGSGCMTSELIDATVARPDPDGVVRLEALSLTGRDPATAIVHAQVRLRDDTLWEYVADGGDVRGSPASERPLPPTTVPVSIPGET